MEATGPAIPGYDVVRLLGRGGSGDVWLVRSQGAGELRAAKVLRATPDGHGIGAPPPAPHRRELRRLRSQTHPHLLQCYAAARDSRSGQPVLIAQYAAGGSLERLVAARSRLSPGETVTAVGPVAQAAAALHLRGSVHRDIAPGNILFTADGRPLLADFGEARCVGDRAGTARGTEGFSDPFTVSDAALEPASDVYSLGAVAWFCLVGSAPALGAERAPLRLLFPDVGVELAAAIEAALAEDPAARPSAAEFAHAVLRSGRPEPVDLAPAVEPEVLPQLITRLQAGSVARARGARRRAVALGRRNRRFWFVVGSGAATAITAAVLVLSAALAPETSPDGPAASSVREGDAWTRLPDGLRKAAESDHPAEALRALAEIRAMAIGARDRDLLQRVNVTGSEAAIADRTLMDGLEKSGQRLEGFTSRVLEAEIAGTDDGGRAVVRVRLVTPEYTVRGAEADGSPAPRPAREQTLRVVLLHGESGWKVAQVLPA